MTTKVRWLLLALLLTCVIGGRIWQVRTARPGEVVETRAPNRGSFSPPVAPMPEKSATPQEPIAKTEGKNAFAAAEKAERIARIRDDYEEHARKLGAEFAAAGENFPGGLSAYLRQLALLEQEKWKDYAALLSSQELEDLELQETRAGKLVQRWLADAPISDEQRRTAFRLQREFDHKHALVFDLAPAALLAREAERYEVQEKILRALGREGFAAWMRSDGAYYDNFARFVAQHGLIADKATELWRLKNQFTLQTLANEGRTGASDEERELARVALVEATRERIQAMVGASAMNSADPAVFAWLPRGKK